MKTNKTMRAASVLLIAVLMTTCAISGTFAKYTSSATGSDSARVAYWGFGNSSLTIDDLFSDTYDSSVTGTSGANVVAPGTTGSVKVEFKYDQTASGSITAPEVAYKVDVTADITGFSGGYDPIKWALTSSDAEPSTDDWKNANDFKSYINATLDETSIQAGTLPKLNSTYYIHWKWDFDDATSSGSNDTNDTALGNAADLANVKLTLTVQATQID